MIEIWEERNRSKRTCQRQQSLYDNKKGWLSDLELHVHIYKESCPQEPNTIIETLDTEKQEPSNRIETQNNYDQNIPYPSHTEQRLTQE